MAPFWFLFSILPCVFMAAAGFSFRRCFTSSVMVVQERGNATGGETVRCLLSFAVVAGKPVPMAVSQSVSGAKELSGLLATPKWVRFCLVYEILEFFDRLHHNRVISTCAAFWYLAHDCNFLKHRRLLGSWKWFADQQVSLRMAEMGTSKRCCGCRAVFLDGFPNFSWFISVFWWVWCLC